MAETVSLVSHLQDFNSDMLAKYFWEENQFRYDRWKATRFHFRDDLKALSDKVGKIEDFLHIAEECGVARNIYDTILRMFSNVRKTSWMGHKGVYRRSLRLEQIEQRCNL